MNDLYDQPLARAGDPITSHLAAEKIRPHLAALHEWTVRCVTETPGATQGELGRKYCENDPRKIGRRLVEVERMGLLRRGDIRKCSISGRPAVTWWPVEAVS